jgi:hypothetical protein
VCPFRPLRVHVIESSNRIVPPPSDPPSCLSGDIFRLAVTFVLVPRANSLYVSLNDFTYLIHAPHIAPPSIFVALTDDLTFTPSPPNLPNIFRPPHGRIARALPSTLRVAAVMGLPEGLLGGRGELAEDVWVIGGVEVAVRDAICCFVGERGGEGVCDVLSLMMRCRGVRVRVEILEGLEGWVEEVGVGEMWKAVLAGGGGEGDRDGRVLLGAVGLVVARGMRTGALKGGGGLEGVGRVLAETAGEGGWDEFGIGGEVALFVAAAVRTHPPL